MEVTGIAGENTGQFIDGGDKTYRTCVDVARHRRFT